MKDHGLVTFFRIWCFFCDKKKNTKKENGVVFFRCLGYIVFLICHGIQICIICRYVSYVDIDAI